MSRESKVDAAAKTLEKDGQDIVVNVPSEFAQVGGSKEVKEWRDRSFKWRTAYAFLLVARQEHDKTSAFASSTLNTAIEETRTKCFDGGYLRRVFELPTLVSEPRSGMSKAALAKAAQHIAEAKRQFQQFVRRDHDEARVDDIPWPVAFREDALFRQVQHELGTLFPRRQEPVAVAALPSVAPMHTRPEPTAAAAAAPQLAVPQAEAFASVSDMELMNLARGLREKGASVYDKLVSPSAASIQSPTQVLVLTAGQRMSEMARLSGYFGVKSGFFIKSHTLVNPNRGENKIDAVVDQKDNKESKSKPQAKAKPKPDVLERLGQGDIELWLDQILAFDVLEHVGYEGKHIFKPAFSYKAPKKWPALFLRPEMADLTEEQRVRWQRAHGPVGQFCQEAFDLEWARIHVLFLQETKLLQSEPHEARQLLLLLGGTPRNAKLRNVQLAESEEARRHEAMRYLKMTQSEFKASEITHSGGLPAIPEIVSKLTPVFAQQRYPASWLECHAAVFARAKADLELRLRNEELKKAMDQLNHEAEENKISSEERKRGAQQVRNDVEDQLANRVKAEQPTDGVLDMYRRTLDAWGEHAGQMSLGERLKVDDALDRQDDEREWQRNIQEDEERARNREPGWLLPREVWMVLVRRYTIEVVLREAFHPTSKLDDFKRVIMPANFHAVCLDYLSEWRRSAGMSGAGLEMATDLGVRQAFQSFFLDSNKRRYDFSQVHIPRYSCGFIHDGKLVSAMPGGQGVLFAAICADKPDLVAWLLGENKSGDRPSGIADALLVDEHGFTSLHVALMACSPRVFRIVRDHIHQRLMRVQDKMSAQLVADVRTRMQQHIDLLTRVAKRADWLKRLLVEGEAEYERFMTQKREIILDRARRICDFEIDITSRRAQLKLKRLAEANSRAVYVRHALEEDERMEDFHTAVREAYEAAVAKIADENQRQFFPRTTKMAWVALEANPRPGDRPGHQLDEKGETRESPEDRLARITHLLIRNPDRLLGASSTAQGNPYKIASNDPAYLDPQADGKIYITRPNVSLAFNIMGRLMMADSRTTAPARELERIRMSKGRDDQDQDLAQNFDEISRHVLEREDKDPRKRQVTHPWVDRQILQSRREYAHHVHRVVRIVLERYQRQGVKAELEADEKRRAQAADLAMRPVLLRRDVVYGLDVFNLAVQANVPQVFQALVKMVPLNIYQHEDEDVGAPVLSLSAVLSHERGAPRRPETASLSAVVSLRGSEFSTPLIRNWTGWTAIPPHYGAAEIPKTPFWSSSNRSTTRISQASAHVESRGNETDEVVDRASEFADVPSVEPCWTRSADPLRQPELMSELAAPREVRIPAGRHPDRLLFAALVYLIYKGGFRSAMIETFYNDYAKRLILSDRSKHLDLTLVSEVWWYSLLHVCMAAKNWEMALFLIDEARNRQTQVASRSVQFLIHQGSRFPIAMEWHKQDGCQPLEQAAFLKRLAEGAQPVWTPFTPLVMFLASDLVNPLEEKPPIPKYAPEDEEGQAQFLDALQSHWRVAFSKRLFDHDIMPIHNSEHYGGFMQVAPLTNAQRITLASFIGRFPGSSRAHLPSVHEIESREPADDWGETLPPKSEPVRSGKDEKVESDVKMEDAKPPEASTRRNAMLFAPTRTWARVLCDFGVPASSALRVDRRWERERAWRKLYFAARDATEDLANTNQVRPLAEEAEDAHALAMAVSKRMERGQDHKSMVDLREMLVSMNLVFRTTLFWFPTNEDKTTGELRSLLTMAVLGNNGVMLRWLLEKGLRPSKEYPHLARLGMEQHLTPIGPKISVFWDIVLQHANYLDRLAKAKAKAEAKGETKQGVDPWKDFDSSVVVQGGRKGFIRELDQGTLDEKKLRTLLVTNNGVVDLMKQLFSPELDDPTHVSRLDSLLDMLVGNPLHDALGPPCFFMFRYQDEIMVHLLQATIRKAVDMIESYSLKMDVAAVLQERLRTLVKAFTSLVQLDLMARGGLVPSRISFSRNTMLIQGIQADLDTKAKSPDDEAPVDELGFSDTEEDKEQAQAEQEVLHLEPHVDTTYANDWPSDSGSDSDSESESESEDDGGAAAEASPEAMQVDSSPPVAPAPAPGSAIPALAPAAIPAPAAIAAPVDAKAVELALAKMLVDVPKIVWRGRWRKMWDSFARRNLPSLQHDLLEFKKAISALFEHESMHDKSDPYGNAVEIGAPPAPEPIFQPPPSLAINDERRSHFRREVTHVLSAMWPHVMSFYMSPLGFNGQEPRRTLFGFQIPTFAGQTVHQYADPRGLVVPKNLRLDQEDDWNFRKFLARLFDDSIHQINHWAAKHQGQVYGYTFPDRNEIQQIVRSLGSKAEFVEDPIVYARARDAYIIYDPMTGESYKQFPDLDRLADPEHIRRVKALPAEGEIEGDLFPDGTPGNDQEGSPDEAKRTVNHWLAKKEHHRPINQWRLYWFYILTGYQSLNGFVFEQGGAQFEDVDDMLYLEQLARIRRQLVPRIRHDLEKRIVAGEIKTLDQLERWKKERVFVRLRIADLPANQQDRFRKMSEKTKQNYYLQVPLAVLPFEVLASSQLSDESPIERIWPKFLDIYLPNDQRIILEELNAHLQQQKRRHAHLFENASATELQDLERSAQRKFKCDKVAAVVKRELVMIPWRRYMSSLSEDKQTEITTAMEYQQNNLTREHKETENYLAQQVVAAQQDLTHKTRELQRLTEEMQQAQREAAQAEAQLGVFEVALYKQGHGKTPESIAAPLQQALDLKHSIEQMKIVVDQATRRLNEAQDAHAKHVANLPYAQYEAKLAFCRSNLPPSSDEKQDPKIEVMLGFQRALDQDRRDQQLTAEAEDAYERLVEQMRPWLHEFLGFNRTFEGFMFPPSSHWKEQCRDLLERMITSQYRLLIQTKRALQKAMDEQQRRQQQEAGKGLAPHVWSAEQEAATIHGFSLGSLIQPSPSVDADREEHRLAVSRVTKDQLMVEGLRALGAGLLGTGPVPWKPEWDDLANLDDDEQGKTPRRKMGHTLIKTAMLKGKAAKDHYHDIDAKGHIQQPQSVLDARFLVVRDKILAWQQQTQLLQETNVHHEFEVRIQNEHRSWTKGEWQRMMGCLLALGMAPAFEASITDKRYETKNADVLQVTNPDGRLRQRTIHAFTAVMANLGWKPLSIVAKKTHNGTNVDLPINSVGDRARFAYNVETSFAELPGDAKLVEEFEIKRTVIPLGDFNIEFSETKRWQNKGGMDETETMTYEIEIELDNKAHSNVDALALAKKLEKLVVQICSFSIDPDSPIASALASPSRTPSLAPMDTSTSEISDAKTGPEVKTRSQPKAKLNKVASALFRVLGPDPLSSATRIAPALTIAAPPPPQAPPPPPQRATLVQPGVVSPAELVDSEMVALIKRLALLGPIHIPSAGASDTVLGTLQSVVLSAPVTDQARLLRPVIVWGRLDFNGQIRYRPLVTEHGGLAYLVHAPQGTAQSAQELRAAEGHLEGLFHWAAGAPSHNLSLFWPLEHRVFYRQVWKGYRVAFMNLTASAV